MIRSFLARLAQPEPAPPWKSYTAFQLAVVSWLGAVIGTNLLDVLFRGQSFIFLGGYAIGGLLAFVWFTRGKPEDRAAMRIDTNGRMPLLMVAMLCLGFALAIDLARRYEVVPELRIFQGTAIEWVLAVLFMVIIQPIAEEVVFRGVMYPALRITFGVWTGMFACTLAQALFHFLTYTPAQLDLNTLGTTFAIPYIESLVLTGVRAYTGSTRASIVGHAMFGVLAVVKLVTLGGSN
jgi:membrane protease YdiL (CAAX protease family)